MSIVFSAQARNRNQVNPRLVRPTRPRPSRRGPVPATTQPRLSAATTGSSWRRGSSGTPRRSPQIPLKSVSCTLRQCTVWWRWVSVYTIVTSTHYLS